MTKHIIINVSTLAPGPVELARSILQSSHHFNIFNKMTLDLQSNNSLLSVIIIRIIIDTTRSRVRSSSFMNIDEALDEIGSILD